ncbi:hypothetical protein COEREDRAFT_102894 [Coemansia reversa NRRL 1564]|uniref:Uncharacterized protein n=1 Tax=Coemansia reversa (strain ATCC 12441 / NRRL 1564) TaxID=763665 RepID=A0A2G5B8X3_COERN|nr:hypothetical protein COEREDRAFT_102894 [Coemansia reversa NRRL 1564]|eukprot:PIA15454.1 hypothetical protein COEREDRAFT_102894 [Coemansia reversa NRRL 1564]
MSLHHRHIAQHVCMNLVYHVPCTGSCVKPCCRVALCCWRSCQLASNRAECKFCQRRQLHIRITFGRAICLPAECQWQSQPTQPVLTSLIKPM